MRPRKASIWSLALLAFVLLGSYGYAGGAVSLYNKGVTAESLEEQIDYYTKAIDLKPDRFPDMVDRVLARLWRTYNILWRAFRAPAKKKEIPAQDGNQRQAHPYPTSGPATCKQPRILPRKSSWPWTGSG